MKTIWTQFSTKPNSSTGVGTIIKEFNGKKVKYTYEFGNAYERFIIELFDGDKLNVVGNIWSIGGIPDSSIYITEPSQIKTRYLTLEKNADSYIKTLLS